MREAETMVAMRQFPKMARNKFPAIFVALLAGMLSAGCSRPLSTETFVRRDNAANGVYVYEIELTDTLSTYDIWFYGRTLSGVLQSLPLNVQWLAPSGKRFSETVYMKRIDTDGEKELYRSGVVPSEPGKWQLSVRPVGVDDDFCGLGMICRENPQ